MIKKLKTWQLFCIKHDRNSHLKMYAKCTGRKIWSDAFWLSPVLSVLSFCMYCRSHPNFFRLKMEMSSACYIH